MSINGETFVCMHRIVARLWDNRRPDWLLRLWKCRDVTIWLINVGAVSIQRCRLTSLGIPIVTHICVSDVTSIGSNNGLSPGRRQAIIRTNAGILLIRPLGTNFSEFFVEILIFSFKKMRLKVSSAKRRPFCLGLNELQIRRSHDRLIFYMGIPIHGKGGLYIETGPWTSATPVSTK